MSSAERVLRDLKDRRNLDVYVTIAVAIVVSVLSYFDLVPGPKVASLILATLAVLAFNALNTRDTIADALDQLERSGQRFLDDFPPDLRSRREQSDDIYLIGVDLARTIETSYGAFREGLLRGARIRVLLTDPTSDDAAIDARTQASRPRLADVRNDIQISLRTLADLKASTKGLLEVRTTRAALKFGLNYVDIAKSSATLFVQLYSYRQAGESRPMFRLTSADGEWFHHFRKQAEELWSDAKVVEFEEVITS